MSTGCIIGKLRILISKFNKLGLEFGVYFWFVWCFVLFSNFIIVPIKDCNIYLILKCQNLILYCTENKV